MNERIKLIRKENQITQQEFADRIKMSRNFVAQLEIGTKIPSERTISDICRVFDINETWLRDGTGEMKNPATDDFMTIAAKISQDDKKIEQAIIQYWNLNDEDKQLFLKFLDKFFN